MSYTNMKITQDRRATSHALTDRDNHNLEKFTSFNNEDERTVDPTSVRNFNIKNIFLNDAASQSQFLKEILKQNNKYLFIELNAHKNSLQ